MQTPKRESSCIDAVNLWESDLLVSRVIGKVLLRTFDRSRCHVMLWTVKQGADH